MRLILVMLSALLLCQCKTTDETSEEKGLVNKFKKDDSPWTKWPPEKTKVGKLVELGGVRDDLFKNNLVDRHGPLPNPKCEERWLYARSFDGSCNDLSQPGMGMRGLVFSRNVDPEKYVKPAVERRDIMEPDPQLVVDKLMKKTKEVNAGFLNLFAAAWIQFMTRDWFIRTPQIDLRKAAPYQFKDGLVIAKSNFHPRSAQVGHPTTANEATHWWDFSQVYGSDEETANKLRTMRDGMMKLNPDGVLPTFEYANVAAPNTSADLQQELSAVPYGGWWAGMSVMYHLFVKEHNYIAAQLKKQNPGWNDQKLFDVARLINTALMAKIHTVEWTPAILPNDVARTALWGNWYGILYQKNSKISHWFVEKMKKWMPEWGETTANYKGAASGIVGLNKAQHFNVPFTFTEEFTAVYRLHSLLPEQMTIWDPVSNRSEGKVALGDTLQRGSLQLIRKLGNGDRAKGLEKLMMSFGKSLPGALIPNNYPNFLRELPIAKLMPPEVKFPGKGTLDMAVVDIMRDRERGVPRYNNFRRAIGLKPLKTWDDFVNKDADAGERARQEAVVATMKEVYKDDLEAVDFVVGCLAEGVRPPGFAFGETQFQIFIAMASRRLFSDRFYTEAYTPQYYTQWGIDHIDASNFYHVVTRHFPRLARYMDESHKENAFKPWN